MDRFFYILFFSLELELRGVFFNNLREKVFKKKKRLRERLDRGFYFRVYFIFL